MRTVLSLVFFMVLIATFASAMTMDEAIQEALKNNPELQTARQESIAALGRLDQATQLLNSNPVIEGTSSRKKYPADAGGEEFRNYELRLSQEFEFFGQRGLRKDTAEKEVEKTSQEILDRERVLITEVKDAFARALAAKGKKALADETVKLQEELYTFAETKFKAGDVAALEMNLASVELGKAKRDRLDATREERSAMLSLHAILGIKADASFSVQGELPADAPPVPDKDGLKQLAAFRRPDIKAASAEAESAESAMKLAGRSAFPNVTVSGFIEKDERADITGLVLSVPLPLFNRNQAERAEMRTRAEQAKIRQAGLDKTIDRELEEAYSGLVAAAEELGLFRKEILDKALENLDLMNLSYKEGKIGFFEVRLAQKDTLDAQLAYLDSQLRAQLALNALEKATGGSLK
jgi:cobalt-zinc-cadmium efflux system outer membrane protein